MKYLKHLFLLLLVAIPLALYGAITGTISADTAGIDWTLASGGRYAVGFSGDFGGGTLTINYLIGDTYVTFDNGTFTDDGGIELVMPGPASSTDENFRIILTGSTTPDIDYSIERIQF